MPAFNRSERGRTQNQIPVLPITSIPATMELAMPGAIEGFVD
jgi:hypothetical protein